MKIGDLVMLKSSPEIQMTVTEIFDNEHVRCSWLSLNNELQQGIFHKDTLLSEVNYEEWTPAKEERLRVLTEKINEIQHSKKY
jgi:uncharacterized protein YodC (DUF2158 family)